MSLNLAFGSALACIGLTIPAIAIAMIWVGTLVGVVAGVPVVAEVLEHARFRSRVLSVARAIWTSCCCAFESSRFAE